jgi:uroporphyrin-III C-methyltransferase/precorrin-2 dehydrogenase/sirohydrochlorin ferrochelatase
VTTAQAAAARLKVSLTRRAVARRVQYITGHGPDGQLPHDIDWKSLADPAATTVVYMPVKTLPALVAQACAAGLDPATPAVAVANATRADERTIAGRVSELSALLAEEASSGPVVVMIGSAFASYAQEFGRATEPSEILHDAAALKAGG